MKSVLDECIRILKLAELPFVLFICGCLSNTSTPLMSLSAHAALVSSGVQFCWSRWWKVNWYLKFWLCFTLRAGGNNDYRLLMDKFHLINHAFLGLSIGFVFSSSSFSPSLFILFCLFTLLVINCLLLQISGSNCRDFWTNGRRHGEILGCQGAFLETLGKLWVIRNQPMKLVADGFH